MKAYEKIGWLDHVQDIETGEVIQEGTPVSQVNMNHMDKGIFTNREAVILHEAQIADAQKEIKVLKDATLNNMVNNVFLINFNTVTSVAITSGIYDPVARKIYEVACSRKEASCIIGSLLVELAPVCEKCGGLPDGVLNLQTEAGLSLTGDADVLITGHSIISGKPVRIKLTDYGFEYYGDHAELARVREKRCVYHGRAVSPTKEN
jgi:hypothetical protein